MALYWSLFIVFHDWSWMAAGKACHPCVKNEQTKIGIFEHRRSNYPCVQRLNGFDFDGFHRMGSDKRIAMASYLWSFFSASGIPDGLDTAVDAVGSLAIDIGKGFENLGNLIDNHVIGEPFVFNMNIPHLFIVWSTRTPRIFILIKLNWQYREGHFDA